MKFGENLIEIIDTPGFLDGKSSANDWFELLKSELK